MIFAFPRTRYARHAAIPLVLVPFGLVLGGAWVWPVACLMTVLAAREDDNAAMLLWFGVALGFDPQALLLAPLVTALAIQRRAGAASIGLAALAAGAVVLARTLISDAPALPFPLDLPLSRGAPNLWVFAQALPGFSDLPLTGLALAATIGAGGAYAAWFSPRRIYRHTLPDAVLLCLLVMVELMPATDLTALMIANAVALALAVAKRREPLRWQIAALALGGTCIAFLTPPLAAAMLLMATLLQARAVLKPAANDNPLMPRTV